MGKAFKRLKIPRTDIVVTTKIYRGGKGSNDEMFKHVIEEMEASLKRLQLDYVDIVFSHNHDPYAPMEEFCKTYDWIVKNGKALYWGTSMWTIEETMEARMCCERLGLIGPADRKSTRLNSSHSRESRLPSSA